MRLWPLADGEVISWLRPLRAIHTPGHAWHHLSVFDETADMIYAGDATAFLFERRRWFAVYFTGHAADTVCAGGDGKFH